MKQKNKMPKNRTELFFDIIKHRFSLLLSIGLTVLFFSLPLIITVSWYNSAVSSVTSTIDEADTYTKLFSLLNIKNLLLIGGFIILAIGLSGIYQIIKNLGFNEGVIYFGDFKKGLKENSLNFIICALIIGLLNFLFQYVYFLNAKDNFEYKLTLAILIALIIIMVPIILNVLNQTILYKLKLIHQFKNGFLITFRSFYITYPLGLLNIGVCFLFLINQPIVYLILLGLMPLIISPLLILINVLVNNYLLDQFINKEHFPTIYKKGLNYENHDA